MAAATSQHIVSSSSTPTASHSSSSSNVVGGNFRVGRKIGEGSFGVCFEGELELHSGAEEGWSAAQSFLDVDLAARGGCEEELDSCGLTWRTLAT